MIINQDELSIYDIEALKKEFLQELQNNSFVIDMKNVNKVDFSIIQLLVSAQKSCLNDSKNFELKNLNDEVSAIFKNAACNFLLGDAHE